MNERKAAVQRQQSVYEARGAFPGVNLSLHSVSVMFRRSSVTDVTADVRKPLVMK